MGRQLWLADVLADAFRGVSGFRVEVYPDWAIRGSESFDPIGVLNHHTGGGGTYDNMLRYMMEVSSLRPSCNWATSPPQDGVVRVTVTAAGRANHAGAGSLSYVPKDTGNYRLLGGEHHNTGYEPWPAQQSEAIHRGSAALLRHMGLDESRAADHKDYAGYRGKWDRHSVNLADERAAIKRYLTSTQPRPPEEDDELQTYIAWFRSKAGSNEGMHCYRFTAAGECTWLPTHDAIKTAEFLGARWSQHVDPVIWVGLHIVNGPLRPAWKQLTQHVP